MVVVVVMPRLQVVLLEERPYAPFDGPLVVVVVIVDEGHAKVGLHQAGDVGVAAVGLAVAVVVVDAAVVVG